MSEDIETPKGERKKHKVGLITIVIVILAALGGAMGGQYIYETIRDKSLFGQLDSDLMSAASELNANLPMMVDFMTRLDTVVAIPPKQFYYYYTLIGDQARGVNETLLIEKVRPQSLKHYKNSEEMEMFREKDVELVYVYRNEDGDEIGRFSAAPRDF